MCIDGAMQGGSELINRVQQYAFKLSLQSNAQKVWSVVYIVNFTIQ